MSEYLTAIICLRKRVNKINYTLWHNDNDKRIYDILIKERNELEGAIKILKEK